MPLFTAIGTALGASAATAFSVGVGATAVAAGAGVAAYGAAGGFDSKSGDSRVQVSTDTGTLTDEEAMTDARKRAYRSGILFTSPTGTGSNPETASARLT